MGLTRRQHRHRQKPPTQSKITPDPREMGVSAPRSGDGAATEGNLNSDSNTRGCRRGPSLILLCSYVPSGADTVQCTS